MSDDPSARFAYATQDFVPGLVTDRIARHGEVAGEAMALARRDRAAVLLVDVVAARPG
jgi:hypothetical protein